MRIRNRVAAIAASLAAATTAVIVSSAPAQAAPFPNQEIGVFGGNHCLDNATEIDSVLQMWNCTGGDEQEWAEDTLTPDPAITSFVNFHTKRCITAPVSGAGRVEMEPCGLEMVADSQRWKPFFHFNSPDNKTFWTIWQNPATGLCLGTPTVANGTPLQAMPCDVNTNDERLFEKGH